MKDSLELGSPQKTIGLFSVFSMTLNVMIGTGVFGMPLAYEGAGILLSLLVLLFFFGLAIITLLYLLEGLSRVSTYLKNTFLLNNSIDCGIEIYESCGYTSIASTIGGNGFKLTINVLVLINLLTGLWAFVGTSVGTLSTIYWSFYDDYDKCDVVGHFEKGWECQVTYYGAIMAFGLIAIPLCFLKLGTQSIVHIILTTYASICFVLILLTCIIELSMNGVQYDIKSIDLNGFGTVFLHSAFALILNLNVPDIVQPTKNKKKIHIPFILAISLATLFYGSVGIICSITFGPNVNSPVTLNWGNYTGINGGWGDGNTLWFAYIIRYLVLFFPLVNILSSYPILVITAADNIKSLFTTEFKRKYHTYIHYISVAFCTVIPFCLTCITSSLEVIFNISGSISFVLSFMMPCVFHILSIKLFTKIHLFKTKSKTPYTWIHSIPMISILILLISSCLFILALIIIISELIPNEGNAQSSMS
ncbi:Amino acid transporter transmembrane domain-containing protein [Entamoeba marina]